MVQLAATSLDSALVVDIFLPNGQSSRAKQTSTAVGKSDTDVNTAAKLTGIGGTI